MTEIHFLLLPFLIKQSIYKLPINSRYKIIHHRSATSEEYIPTFNIKA